MQQEHSKTTDHFREKFHVYHCPQVVVYAESGEEIGRLGYLPLSEGDYAKTITDLVEQFQEIQSILDAPTLNCTEERLQTLYKNATRFSSPIYKEKLLQLGLERFKGSFFLLEKYAVLLQKFKFKHPLIQDMRRKVIALDPQNRRGIIAKLAVLEFDKLSQSLKRKDPPEKAAAPLLEYVKKFGSKDPENLWKIEMMIAQYFFSKNLSEQALKHAQASYACAPDHAKQEITDLIEYFNEALAK